MVSDERMRERGEMIAHVEQHLSSGTQNLPVFLSTHTCVSGTVWLTPNAKDAASKGGSIKDNPKMLSDTPFIATGRFLYRHIIYNAIRKGKSYLTKKYV